MEKNSLFKQTLCWLLFVSMLCTLIIVGNATHVLAATQTTYYVATDGDDSNPGTQAAPFATIQKARDVIRTINSNMTGDIIVYIKQGDYYVDETIEFTEADSGTNGHKVIYKNYGAKGSARIIGGKLITGWTQYSGNIYKTNVGIGNKFYDLYENGKRSTKARYPNRIIDSKFPIYQGPYLMSGTGSKSYMTYNSGDLDPSTWSNTTDLQVYIWHANGYNWDWMSATMPVSSINIATRTFNFKQLLVNGNSYDCKYGTTGSRYFVQGVLELLDVPGEWHLDTTTGDLYYWAIDGDIANQKIIVPTVQKIISVAGSSESSIAKNITFEGLQFDVSDYVDHYRYALDGGEPFYESHVYNKYSYQFDFPQFRYGSIFLTNTSNIMVKDCIIRNAGMTGVYMLFNNQNNRIEGCLIENIGYTGVQLSGKYPGEGDVNMNNVITNNIIRNFGEHNGYSSGVEILNASNNEISYSEIYNGPRHGICLTAWPDLGDISVYYSKDNVFKNLYLHNLEQDSGDDGAFFVFGIGKGSNYNNNYAEQILIDTIGAHPSMDDYKPNGINLDAGASGMHLKDIKIINPQHYNFRYDNQHGDVYFVDNCNVYYGSNDQTASFDESRMDYNNIGIKATFPTEYQTADPAPAPLQNVYWSDGFEGTITWDKIAGSSINTSTVYYREGLKSFAANGAGDGGAYIKKSFDSPLNKIVKVDYFDHELNDRDESYCGLSLVSELNSYARVDNGTDIRAIGVENSINDDYYVVNINGTKSQTNILRTYGWHEFKWDYTSGTHVKMYIDDQLVGIHPGVINFDYIGLGDLTGLGFNYYDNVIIYGETEVEPTSYVKVEAEDYTTMSGIQVESCLEGGLNVGYIDSQDWMEYNVDVAESGTYTLKYRVAVHPDYTGGVKFKVGTIEKATTTFLPTGGWQNWVDVTDNVMLDAGSQTIKLECTANGWNLNWFSLDLNAPNEDIQVEAEDYSAMSGIQTESCLEGGLNVAYIDSGDWMEYNVDVPKSGTYAIKYRVAVHQNYTGGVKLKSGTTEKAITTFPPTGGWQNWVDIYDIVTLDAGNQTLKIEVTSNGWNFNWFSLIKID